MKKEQNLVILFKEEVMEEDELLNFLLATNQLDDNKENEDNKEDE